VSIDVMSAVWKHSEMKGNALLTLLAIGDCADDDGFAFPSYDHLAAKTRLSKRTAQNMVRDLLDSDELSLISRGTQGRSNEYSVNVAALRAKPPQVAKPATSPGGNSGGNPGGTQAATPTVSLPTVSTETSEKDSAAQLFDAPAEAPAPDPLEEKLNDVWDTYVNVFGDRLSIKGLTPPRRRTLIAALKATDNDTEVMKRAIFGLKSYRERNPHGSKDVSLDAIFRTGPHSHRTLTEQIEFWAGQAPEESGKGGHSDNLAKHPPAVRAKVKRHRLQVVEMYQSPHLSGVKERGENALAWLKQQANEEPIIEEGRVTGWKTSA
jgi:Helix-turn-helix domain